MRSPVWLPRSTSVPRENPGSSQQDSQQRGRKRRRASDDPISALLTTTVHDAQTPSGGSTTLRGRGRRRSPSEPSDRSDTSNALLSPPGQKYQKKGAGDVTTENKLLAGPGWGRRLDQERKKRSQSPSRSRSKNRASTPRRRRQRTASRSRSHGRGGVVAEDEKSAEDVAMDGDDEKVRSRAAKYNHGGGAGRAAVQG